MTVAKGTPKRWCSISFWHQPHDTCDGTAFNSVEYIEQLEAENAALSAQVVELQKALKTAHHQRDEP